MKKAVVLIILLGTVMLVFCGCKSEPKLAAHYSGVYQTWTTWQESMQLVFAPDNTVQWIEDNGQQIYAGVYHYAVDQGAYMLTFDYGMLSKYVWKAVPTDNNKLIVSGGYWDPETIAELTAD